ncbi:MAG: mercury resistance system periplasmic binding protein MerP [Alphaproteobacteria bacterium]|nr:mercury resistance system periplasmic binding protein MerP [Alphaproteobacteria bacterium]
MKIKISILALVFCLMSSAAFADPRTVTLDVPTMTCPLCPVTIMRSLDGLTGVKKVSVDFPNRTATIEYDDSKISTNQLTEATEKAGYPSTIRKGS